MTEPVNRIFLISDLHGVPNANYNFHVDEKWPKKKLPIDPNGLYNTWIDIMATHTDSYVYYVIDKDFTLGGCCDVAVDTIKKYYNTGEGIDWYVIDLPGAKSKLNLHSLSPEEIVDVHKSLYNLHKSKDLKQVSKSLVKVNDAKDNDVDRMFSSIDRLHDTICAKANYNNRFIITEHYWEEIIRWMKYFLFTEKNKHERLEKLYRSLHTAKSRMQKYQLLFPSITDNDYIHHMDVSIGDYTRKTRGRKKLNSPFFKKLDGELDWIMTRRAETEVKQVDLDKKPTQLPTISRNDHSIIGYTVYQHLTETTKLFTM